MGRPLIEDGNHRNYINPKTLWYYKVYRKTLQNLVLSFRINLKESFGNCSESSRAFIQVEGGGGGGGSDIEKCPIIYGSDIF